MEKVPVPELRDGEILLRTLWLSLDPYMRGRMSDVVVAAATGAVGSVVGQIAKIKDCRVLYREDVVRGLENAPGAFLGLLEGRNFGKLVVDVGGAQT